MCEQLSLYLTSNVLTNELKHFLLNSTSNMRRITFRSTLEKYSFFKKVLFFEKNTAPLSKLEKVLFQKCFPFLKKYFLEKAQRICFLRKNSIIEKFTNNLPQKKKNRQSFSRKLLFWKSVLIHAHYRKPWQVGESRLGSKSLSVSNE